MKRTNLFLAALVLIGTTCKTNLQAASISDVAYMGATGAYAANAYRNLKATNPANIGTVDVEAKDITEVVITINGDKQASFSSKDWNNIKSKDYRDGFIQHINNEFDLKQNDTGKKTISFDISVSTKEQEEAPILEHSIASNVSVTLEKALFAQNLWDHAIAPYLTLKSELPVQRTFFEKNSESEDVDYTFEGYTLAITNKDYYLTSANVLSGAAITTAAWHGMNYPIVTIPVTLAAHTLSNAFPPRFFNPTVSFKMDNNTLLLKGKTQEVIIAKKDALRKKYKQTFDETTFETVKNTISRLTFTYATNDTQERVLSGSVGDGNKRRGNTYTQEDFDKLSTQAKSVTVLGALFATGITSCRTLGIANSVKAGLALGTLYTGYRIYNNVTVDKIAQEARDKATALVTALNISIPNFKDSRDRLVRLQREFANQFDEELVD
ncbi:MAG: uncharacterized membrane protein YebE (DUF533 family) [Alteromonas naphthalenivorans]|jgi:uncharacterized membrane protein YebE (DUF533 family)